MAYAVRLGPLSKQTGGAEGSFLDTALVRTQECLSLGRPTFPQILCPMHRLGPYFFVVLTALALSLSTWVP